MATKKKSIPMAPKTTFQSLKSIVNPEVATNLDEQSGVGESKHETPASTAAPADNAASPAEESETRPLTADEIHQIPGARTVWEQFIEYAEEYYQDTDKTRGVTVWIDDDVKDVLDKIKASGEVRVPVRHMVSAMCRIFIEENKDDIIRALTKSKRKNSLL